MSELTKRIASGAVMIGIAVAAFSLGGLWFRTFVALTAVIALYEWWGLVSRVSASAIGRALWMTAGLIYVGSACLFFVGSYELGDFAILPAFIAVALVIATDIGAFAAGRAIGGPKLWPAVSPNKTWAGLAGGITASAVVMMLVASSGSFGRMAYLAAFGAVVAVAAQAGDFFESWIKRRAGVKDSGRLIPGHGGILDRIDGLLAVEFIAAIAMLVAGAVIA